MPLWALQIPEAEEILINNVWNLAVEHRVRLTMLVHTDTWQDKTLPSIETWIRPSVVSRTCNASTWEGAEAGGFFVCFIFVISAQLHGETLFKQNKTKTLIGASEITQWLT